MRIGTTKSMASVHQYVRRRLGALVGALGGAAAVALLAGCSATTYGTGVDPGLQTIKDVAGIAMLGGDKKPPIDYEPRPKVVAPPQGAAAPLPPPGTETASATNTPNWPNDPDAQAAKLKADVAAREARGEAPAPLNLPVGSYQDPSPPPTTRTSRSNLVNNTPLTAEQHAAVTKAFADAKGSLAVDASGHPVRKYLTEPPTEYREPDPTQPVTFTEKKKKFHWWWQKQDNGDALTPDATAASTTTPPPTTN
jgi:hypothetical protein